MLRNLALALGSVALFLGLLEAGLWLAGTRPALSHEDPFVGFESRLRLFDERRGEDGRLERVTAPGRLRYFNAQRFPAHKRDGTRRVFCVGGSTTYGRPYDDRTSFCGWLRLLLPEADPSSRWEVVNAGGISYASYRVAALMQELAGYEPDLFVVYSGHNEFLEERTYREVRRWPAPVEWARLQLNRTRTYSALRRLWGRGAATEPPTVLPAEVDTVLDHSVGPSAYHRDDALRRQILAHYRLNLGRIVEIARGAGAEALLVVPASNLRHCSPFKSRPGDALTPAEVRRGRALLDEAAAARAEGRLDAALRALSRATALDPRSARAHYQRARLLEELGRWREARDDYVRARDEDVCPLRALSEMQEIVAEVAEASDAPLVDFAALVRERSEHGIPGSSLFLDHVHPTIEGHRLLALAVIETLTARGDLHPGAAWGDAAIARAIRAVEGGMDRREHGKALANVAQVLGWAGKHEDAYAVALRAIALAPDHAQAHVQAAGSAFRLGRIDEALEHYREAVRLEPRDPRAQNNLGHTLAARGRLDEAIVHYRAALRLDPELAAAHYNLGRALARGGDPVQAERHLEECLRLEPTRAEAHFELGRLSVRRGEREAGRRHLVRALELRPGWEKPRAELERCCGGAR